MSQLTVDALDARPTHRLFLGIWPDLPTALEIAGLAQRLHHERIMQGRPVDTDRLHMTLFHLGDFAGAVSASVIPMVRQAADSLRFARLEICLDQAIGTGKHMILRSSKDLPELQRFRAALGEALILGGLHRHFKPTFLPHVTLSYEPSDAVQTPIAPVRWTVRGFHLVESLLGKHRHIKQGSWALEG